MALLGRAALAMWWDIAPDVRPGFEHWHAHEHFPERLSLPGFLRASRWHSSAGGDGVFVLYEVSGHDVLSSPSYAARLDAPSPWSTRLMPHHRRMVRSQCHVLASAGGVTTRHATTIRLSPRGERSDVLRVAISRIASSAWLQAGLFGVHLLAHEAPSLGPTTEQRIRGSADEAAGWIVLACGYDADALETFCRSLLADPLVSAAMERIGEIAVGRFELAVSATPSDVSSTPPKESRAD